ncbi:MAG: hypothetical protein AAFQ91_08135 [Cyanobacteria bacterium J06621_15]
MVKSKILQQFQKPGFFSALSRHNNAVTTRNPVSLGLLQIVQDMDLI